MINTFLNKYIILLIDIIKKEDIENIWFNIYLYIIIIFLLLSQPRMIINSTSTSNLRSPVDFVTGVRTRCADNESAVTWASDPDSSDDINSQRSIAEVWINLRSLIERHKLKLPRVQYLMRKNIKQNMKVRQV